MIYLSLETLRRGIYLLDWYSSISLAASQPLRRTRVYIYLKKKKKERRKEKMFLRLSNYYTFLPNHSRIIGSRDIAAPGLSLSPSAKVSPARACQQFYSLLRCNNLSRCPDLGDLLSYYCGGPGIVHL